MEKFVNGLPRKWEIVTDLEEKLMGELEIRAS